MGMKGAVVGLLTAGAICLGAYFSYQDYQEQEKMKAAQERIDKAAELCDLMEHEADLMRVRDSALDDYVQEACRDPGFNDKYSCSPKVLSISECLAKVKFVENFNDETGDAVERTTIDIVRYDPVDVKWEYEDTVQVQVEHGKKRRRKSAKKKRKWWPW